LQKEYLAQHNARFCARPAAPAGLSPQATGSAGTGAVLFCLETERSISNDWVCAMRTLFSLERTSDYPAQAKVTVCEWEDGRTEIRYKGKARRIREIERRSPHRPRSVWWINRRSLALEAAGQPPWRKPASITAMMRPCLPLRPKSSA